VPTWGEVRQWDSAAIGEVADGLKKSRDTLVSTDERLSHSDQVDPGGTRPTKADNSWPTDNPERGDHREPDEPDAYPERGY